MEDFVVKYFTYIACLAIAGWSVCMFIGMLSNCIRMRRRHPDPDAKLSAFMTKCRIETVIYLILPVICAALALYIHARYNT